MSEMPTYEFQLLHWGYKYFLKFTVSFSPMVSKKKKKNLLLKKKSKNHNPMVVQPVNDLSNKKVLFNIWKETAFLLRREEKANL